MDSYSFLESRGQLNNDIMIMKENSVVVDTDIVVIVDLNPAGQTAQNRKCDCINIYICCSC